MGMVFKLQAAIIHAMKTGGKIGICSLVGVLLSASAHAASPTASAESSASDGQPYGAIIERNVFNLHAPPPPPNPEDLIKKTPPPKLTLTGITTILGRKLVFLTMPAAKPGTAPDSIMLAEGQGQNDVEVQSIDEKAGVVKVSNHGVEQNLDFEHDGAKPSAPPPGMAPPATTLPPPSAPPPNVMSLPRPGNVVRPIRTLSPRGSPFSDNNNGGFGGGAVGSMSASGNSQQAPMSEEEQVVMIEAQRMKYQQDGNPLSKILPITQMTPGPNGEPMGEVPAPQ